MSSSVCLAPYSHLETADIISEIYQRKPELGCSLPSDCVLSSYSVGFADEGSYVNIIYDECRGRKGFPILVVGQGVEKK